MRSLLGTAVTERAMRSRMGMAREEVEGLQWTPSRREKEKGEREEFEKKKEGNKTTSQLILSCNGVRVQGFNHTSELNEAVRVLRYLFLNMRLIQFIFRDIELG